MDNLSPDRLIAPNRSTIGRYRLVARLGSGGMADVYLAMASGMVGFTKLSVVKVLKPEFAHDSEHVAMFLDEARLAARLNHPNVVQTNEVGEDQGLYYLVMEYLEGQTLKRVLKLSASDESGRLLPSLLYIISDMLAGLHHAHELCDFDGTPLNVVHRDVSPHNVFVTYEGQTKVVDFGIAKAAGSSHLTHTGMLKGKLGYMAPEQARARGVDRRADIFPAGVILWEALARKRIWGGESDLGVLQRLGSGELPSIREHAPGLPEALYQICERALAIDPDARFSSAQEMREALEAFLANSGSRVTATDVATLMAARFREQRTAIRTLVESALSTRSDSLPLPVLTNSTGLTPEVPGTDLVSRSGNSQLSTIRSDSASLASNFHLTSTGTPRPALAPPSPLRRVLPWLGAVVTSAAVTAWALYQRPNLSPPLVASAASASVPTNEAQAPLAPAAPDLVELQVRVTPSNATLYLDGHEFKGPPFRRSLPREGQHELRAEAPGYQTATQTVTLQGDVLIDLALVRQAAAPRRVVAAPPPPPPRPRAQPPRSASPTPNSTEPSFDLPAPRTKRPVQPIDSESPY
ncbi:MAG TPA: serine/threonine-protein kinase [Polyangiaceae bacterium]|nr:serine/threonine-protein kinase [Polyangiaceae bacterium]